MNSVYLGIDLGGSNISAALITPKGKILYFEKIETQARQGCAAVVRRIIQLAQRSVSQAQLAWEQIPAVGIGVPGVLDIKRGVVKTSPNLPGWKNVPLRQRLQTAWRKPVVMDNDANAAAYGEKWLGAGKHDDHMVMYTVGTGVGGGIIINGHILHGSKGGAGELGHTTVSLDGPRCACGNYGCLEALVSGAAIARAGRQVLRSGAKTMMRTLCEGKINTLSAKQVFQAAGQGDAAARALVQKTGTLLGVAVANIINLLNPSLILIGGGVSGAGEMLLRSVRAEVKRRAMKELTAGVNIRQAALADKAGVYGAAGLAVCAYPPAKSKVA